MTEQEKFFGPLPVSVEQEAFDREYFAAPPLTQEEIEAIWAEADSSRQQEPLYVPSPFEEVVGGYIIYLGQPE